MPHAAAPTAVRFEHHTDHGTLLGVGTPAPRLSWVIPEAEHTGGIDARPREYERRVVGFFDQAL